MSIDLTLDRIKTLISCLPESWYTRPTCHVAGTNGKGSVTALLSSIFILSDLSVGRFNSPHLVSIYDCILINNDPITAEKYEEAKQIVNRANTKSGADASSFELLTLTALVALERAKVDIVVVEVGMGGRLDATNVIPDYCILVSALTAVDLDHQTFLGNTVAEIAKEKAGIARNATPFVMGQQKYEAVVNAVEGCVPDGYLIRAQRVQFTLPCFPSDIVSVALPLYGVHQLENLGLAVTIVSTLLQDPANFLSVPGLRGVDLQTIRRGIEATKWRGRLSIHSLATSSGPSISLLADGAHNPASAATLGNFIESLLSFRGEVLRKLSLTYILALSHSPPKTPLQTLAPLFSPSVVNHVGLRGHIRVALVRFTPPDGMPWVKSVSPSEMRKAVSQLGTSGANVWAPEDDAAAEHQLVDALGWASNSANMDKDRGEELVVVAGSLYLVADLYRLPNVK
ncbi:Mur ligase [Athelia psychrophila]|uniref:Mur ligase n=1 Tax=Athelia psychrophila TaxID=1759441 RepID=A0A166UBD4_9AGAM|nr:Mur ligase [Fibularhizoctonia sp. CBS 109695]